MKKNTVLIMTLIVGIGIISACTSSRSSVNATENASTGTAQQSETAENNQANNKEMLPTPAKETDILAGFKKGNDYKTAVRPKLLKDGWQPARTDEGEATCQSSGMPICEEFPELEDGPSSGQGFINFRWKKGEKVLIVTTVDDPPFFDSYEFEKPSKQSSESQSTSPDVLGKYKCCEDGVEGRYSLDLKSNNVAAYKQVNEDSDGSGTGSWNWDENKEFISVNLTVKSNFVDGETLEQKTETEKVTFKLKKNGKDLKIVEETLSPKELDGYFIGKIFKKLQLVKAFQ